MDRRLSNGVRNGQCVRGVVKAVVNTIAAGEWVGDDMCRNVLQEGMGAHWKFASLNVRAGMCSKFAESIVDSWMDMMEVQGTCMLLLQEMNCTNHGVAKLKAVCRLRNFELHCSTKTKENEGVAVLISPEIRKEGFVQKIVVHDMMGTVVQGRAMWVTIHMEGGRKMHVVNVYGVANTVQDDVKKALFNFVTYIASSCEQEEVIIGGDFNAVDVDNVTKDRGSGRLSTNDRHDYSLIKCMKDEEFKDVFRQRHNDKNGFTWESATCKSRIDGWWCNPKFKRMWMPSIKRDAKIGVDSTGIYDTKSPYVNSRTRDGGGSAGMGTDHRAVVMAFSLEKAQKSLGRGRIMGSAVGCTNMRVKTSELIGKSKKAIKARMEYEKQWKANVGKDLPKWQNKLEGVKPETPLWKTREVLSQFASWSEKNIMSALVAAIGHKPTGRKAGRSKDTKRQSTIMKQLSDVIRMWRRGISADGVSVVPEKQTNWSGLDRAGEHATLAATLGRIRRAIGMLVKYRVLAVGVHAPVSCNEQEWRDWAAHVLAQVQTELTSRTAAIKSEQEDIEEAEEEKRRELLKKKSLKQYIREVKPRQEEDRVDFTLGIGRDDEHLTETEIKVGVKETVSQWFQQTKQPPPVVQCETNEEGRKRHSIVQGGEHHEEWGWFASLYKQKAGSSTQLYDACMCEVQEEEWYEHISKLPNDSGPGPSGITYTAIKEGPWELIALYRAYVNACLRARVVPAQAKHGEIVLIPKQKGAGVAQSRPLTMLETITRKLITKLINDRVMKVLEENGLLEQSPTAMQYGFRPGKGCTEALHVLNAAMEDAHEHKKELHVVFCDFSKAFDKCQYWSMCLAYERFGMPDDLIEMLCELHEGQTRCVRTPMGVTENFEVSSGTAQGDPISPLNWTLLMDGLLTRMNAQEDAYKMSVDGGPDLDPDDNSNIKIHALAYADDLAQLSGSRAGAEEKLRVAAQFGAAHNVLLNPSKMQYIQIEWEETGACTSAGEVEMALKTTSREKDLSVPMGEGVLQVPIMRNNQSVRYLGIRFTGNLSFAEQRGILQYIMHKIIKDLGSLKLDLEGLRYCMRSLFIGYSSFSMQMSVAEDEQLDEWDKNMRRVVMSACDGRKNSDTALLGLPTHMLGWHCADMKSEVYTHLGSELWSHIAEEESLVGKVRKARLVRGLAVSGNRGKRAKNVALATVSKLLVIGVRTEWHKGISKEGKTRFMQTGMLNDQVIQPMYTSTTHAWRDRRVTSSMEISPPPKHSWTNGSRIVHVKTAFVKGEGEHHKNSLHVQGEGHCCNASWSAVEHLRDDWRQSQHDVFAIGGCVSHVGGYCACAVQAELTGVLQVLQRIPDETKVVLVMSSREAFAKVNATATPAIRCTARKRGRMDYRFLLNAIRESIIDLQPRGAELIIVLNDGAANISGDKSDDRNHADRVAAIAVKVVSNVETIHCPRLAPWSELLVFANMNDNTVAHHNVRKYLRKACMLKKLQKSKQKNTWVGNLTRQLPRVDTKTTDAAWATLESQPLKNFAMALRCHALKTQVTQTYPRVRSRSGKRAFVAAIGRGGLQADTHRCMCCESGEAADTVHILGVCSGVADIRDEIVPKISALLKDSDLSCTWTQFAAILKWGSRGSGDKTRGDCYSVFDLIQIGVVPRVVSCKLVERGGKTNVVRELMCKIVHVIVEVMRNTHTAFFEKWRYRCEEYMRRMEAMEGWNMLTKEELKEEKARQCKRRARDEAMLAHCADPGGALVVDLADRPWVSCFRPQMCSNVTNAPVGMSLRHQRQVACSMCRRCPSCHAVDDSTCVVVSTCRDVDEVCVGMCGPGSCRHAAKFGRFCGWHFNSFKKLVMLNTKWKQLVRDQQGVG